jgi:protein gp37
MNYTKIEWTDRTLNPIVGCPHGCDFCYARKQAKRFLHRCKLCYDFVPHPHLERLEQLNPRQKPKKIFIDSMWDWNAKGVEDSWILAILDKMQECKQHVFQILSKRPIRYNRFEYPLNVWLGTSVCDWKDNYRIHDLLKTPGDNLKFISYEPVHGPLKFWLDSEKTIKYPTIGWIIIGAETGNRKGRIIPETKWIEDVLENARIVDLPIFIKNNVGWPEKIQEFPRSLQGANKD